MATVRFDMRLDESIKAKAKKAAILSGKQNLKEYVVSLMEKDATKVIEEHKKIVVENDIFDRFMTACKKARKPNEALIKAAKFSQKSGIK